MSKNKYMELLDEEKIKFYRSLPMNAKNNRKREEAKQFYILNNAEPKPGQIAEIFGVNHNTVRGWKRKDDWDKAFEATLKRTDVEKWRNAETNVQKAEGFLDIELPFDWSDDDVKECDPKELKWIINYIRTNNKRQSGLMIGLPPSSVDKYGQKMLQKPYVLNLINKVKSSMTRVIMQDIYDVMDMYASIMGASPLDCLQEKEITWVERDEKGNIIRDSKNKPVIRREKRLELRPLEQIDGRIVKRVSQSADGSVTVEMFNKIPAMKELQDFLGFIDPATQERLAIEKAKMLIELEQTRNGRRDNALADGVIRAMEKRKGTTSGKDDEDEQQSDQS